MLMGVPAETPADHTPSAVTPQTAPRHGTPGHTRVRAGLTIRCAGAPVCGCCADIALLACRER